jgi:hypothetical protein
LIENGSIPTSTSMSITTSTISNNTIPTNTITFACPTSDTANQPLNV